MNHVWVKMSYVPIEVEKTIVGGVEGISIYVTEAAEEISHEEAMYGCWLCHTPLTIDSFNTPCEPPQIN